MHTSHADHPPPLFSPVRIISFLTCILVALASGTNYVGPGCTHVPLIDVDIDLQVFSGSYLPYLRQAPRLERGRLQPFSFSDVPNLRL